jgi:transketolase
LMGSRPDVKALREKARKIRRTVLEFLTEAGSGHPGGSLSAVEILLALYDYKLRVDPKNPDDPNRDIFIMSKGHACPVLYTVLAMRGFFPERELVRFRKFGSILQGHAWRGVPGVELSTGSLGQGLSVANGFALADRLDGRSRRVYCLLGDGEIEEGAVWEAVATAGFRKLASLTRIRSSRTAPRPRSRT